MTYPVEILPKIMNVIEGLRNGKTLTRSCHDAGVSVSVTKTYVAKNAELQGAYDDAVIEGFDRMADALADIRSDLIYGVGNDPKMAQVQSSNLKWLLARRRPELYGDKVEHVHTLSVDQQIIEALNAGRQRLVAQAIDVDFKVIEPPADTAPDPQPNDLQAQMAALGFR